MKPSPTRPLCVCLLVVAVGFMDAAGLASPAVQWGVEVGDEFTYLLQKKTMDPSVSSQIDEFVPFINMLEAGQKMIARVDALAPISETTDAPWSMPLSNCTLIRENDSEVMMQDMNMIVIPLNIWHLNSSQFNMTYGEGSSLVNTTLQFGSIYEGQFWAGVILVSVNLEMVYSKVDGSLDRMMMRVEAYWSEVVNVLITRWMSGTTTTRSPTEDTSGSWPLLALLGPITGAILVIAIVTVAWLRRRRIT